MTLYGSMWQKPGLYGLWQALCAFMWLCGQQSGQICSGMQAPERNYMRAERALERKYTLYLIYWAKCGPGLGEMSAPGTIGGIICLIYGLVARVFALTTPFRGAKI